ncbi:MAG: hypothetical protein NXI30_20770 [bacterium]|nr:hypothetical protein [bacterium]
MDEILNSFLKSQREEGLRLAAESDLLELIPADDSCFVAIFSCKGLVRAAEGEVRERDHFEVGIRFPEDYLRYVDPSVVLTWLSPSEIWHPNIRAPFICLGHIAPGTPLVDLLHRCFEIITFDNVTMHEGDALNPHACAWARHNRERFPVDTRPIKHGSSNAGVEFLEVGS